MIGSVFYNYLGSLNVSLSSVIANQIFITPHNIMAQIIDPVPQNGGDSILCCYVNATSQIQVARITNIVNWYFERVVFPGQRLVFEALAEGLLEIHSGMMATAILSDTIPCHRLCVNESSSSEEDNTLITAIETNQNQPVLEAVEKPSSRNKTAFKTAISC
jgi:hypothetical protein